MARKFWILTHQMSLDSWSILCHSPAFSNRLECWKWNFYLNTRINFTVFVTKDWNRLPREIVDFTLLEIFKNWLDIILHHMLSDDPFEQGGWSKRLTRLKQVAPSNLTYSVVLFITSKTPLWRSPEGCSSLAATTFHMQD